MKRISLFIGLSKNSSQLTTSITSITIVDRLCCTQTSTGGESGIFSWMGVLSTSDVIRPHTSGIADGGSSSRASIHVTAIAL